MGAKKLVIGASGFLGSHVTQQLVAAGEDVRVLLRPTSSDRGIAGLDVERHVGDVFDVEVVRKAMKGCDVVYYCVVDARAWLLDTTPLWRTNLHGLRGVLTEAMATDLDRFVFTSTIGTIGVSDEGAVNEDASHNWSRHGGDYIRSRLLAERIVMDYSRCGLPAVTMCVANTYGPGDWLPTPHGSLLAAAVHGELPCYVESAAEVVGIEDAAKALILASERGRVGHRYIVSESYTSTRELVEVACGAVGVEPPRIGIPVSVAKTLSYGSEAVARLRGRDTRFRPIAIRLMHIMTPLDHSKATRELGWEPSPISEAVARAAAFYLGERVTAAG